MKKPLITICFISILYLALVVGSGEHIGVNFPGETVVIDKSHYEIHEGDHYFIKTYIENTGGAGTADYFAFTAPDNETRIHAKVWLAADSDFIITIYEDSNITGGVSVPGFNNDRNSNNTAQLIPVAAPTINTLGNIMWQSRNGGGKEPVGVTPVTNYEIIAKAGSTYVFELKKQTTADGVVNIDFWWYEEY